MSTSVDRNHPGIRVLISRSPRPIHEAVQVSGIDPSPQVVNNDGVGTWRSLVAHLNGVHNRVNPIFAYSLMDQGFQREIGLHNYREFAGVFWRFHPHIHPRPIP